ncbi:MAG: carboxypeptidase regulatory-like domain-containing protein, partial [Opitutaceae bacterium]
MPLLHSLLRGAFAATLFLLAGRFTLPAVRAAEGPAASGIVEGRVLHGGSGDYLENARVTVEGANLEAASRSDGSFTLAPVPAGTARLRVFFTGLAPQVFTVDVPAGATVRRDITLAPAAGRTGETVRLEAFAVAASREMDAAAIAINEQRFASNLRTVVSTDEFGTVAEGHVGEFMKFLPGVTMEYAGGNAREISINGAPAAYVPVTVDGFG